MKKSIGIDLGTNSIGWAIREENNKLENQIIGKGVLLFEKGVATDKGNEYPKVQKRTESRGKRRNYQAEKYRKYQLLEYLIKREMCPLTIEELDKWRKYQKGNKREYPQSEPFINWLRFDFNGDGKPDFHLLNRDRHESFYVFRAFAIDEKFKHVYDSNPHILGRVLYQLVQRRGFKGRDEEEAKTMLNGSEKTNTAGRNAIASYIDEYGTLGAALYHYQKDVGGRIRCRYNLRKDFEIELKEICRVHNLSDSEYQLLWKSIIWQRPLRTQKGLVGLCTFEKNKRRVAISHPLYQEYRTWIQINNLKIIPPPNVASSEYLLQKIYPLFIRKSDFEIAQLLKQIEKDGARMDSKYALGKLQKTKLSALGLFYDFNQILGEDWKNKYAFDSHINERPSVTTPKVDPEYTTEDIWHVLQTFDSKEKLEEFAQNKLKIDKEKAARFAQIRLDAGHATLSLSAVKKILPYLRRGIMYSSAIYLANLNKVLGGKEVTDDIVSFLVGEVSEVNAKVVIRKSLNDTVNRLIIAQVESENRYFIDNDRELDREEKELVATKLSEVLGTKTWNELSTDDQARHIDYVEKEYKAFLRKRTNNRGELFLPVPRFHQELFKALQEKYDLPDENIKHLWHPAEQEQYRNAEIHHKVSIGNKTLYIPDSRLDKLMGNNPDLQRELIEMRLLGDPEPISKGFKNPMALKTLHRLKQLLNELLQSEKIDEDTRVIIEIARELNDNNKRAAIRTYQNRRERENLKFQEEIEEINTNTGANFDPTDKQLLTKVRLWHEQNKQCFYTGKSISCTELFNGNKYDIEHTIPASLSFDSELKNLTLADTDFNRTIKKKQIPSQLANHEEILQRVSFMEANIEKLERDYRDSLRYTKTLSDKGQKDQAIQKRHLIKFELDYWRQKYETFTLKEYKPGWRNSQLRDTQVMTKYALPYLKTVFNNVSVQKGSVVDDFKRIYKVFLDEKKDRSRHSHHAVDAAILTLIPTPYHREKELEKYNLASEEGRSYHSTPKGWQGFNANHIINIEHEVLANSRADDRILTKTYKKVRKRGKVIKGQDGQPLWTTGDTIRGQLHKESFYGAIKQAKRENGKIIFDESGQMVLDEEIKMVIRRNLKFKGANDTDGFKSLEELEDAIVDKELFKSIKTQCNGTSFKEAMEQGFYMLDKKGNRVNKIRRVRCFESIKHSTAQQIHQHSYSSKKEYKQTTYAANDMLPYCLYYEGLVKGKVKREIKILSLLDVAELKINDKSDLLSQPLFATSEKDGLPIKTVLKQGDRFLFYKERKEELKDIEPRELLSRLYNVYQFESDGRMKFKHHLLAGDMTEAKKQFKEESSLIFDSYSPLYRISQGNWNFAIEGVDFEIKIDGTVIFKF